MVWLYSHVLQSLTHCAYCWIKVLHTLWLLLHVCIQKIFQGEVWRVFLSLPGGIFFEFYDVILKNLNRPPPMTPPPRSVHVLLMKPEITYIKWYVHIFQKVNYSYFIIIIITSSYHFLMTVTQFTMNVLHSRSVWSTLSDCSSTFGQRQEKELLF